MAADETASTDRFGVRWIAPLLTAGVPFAAFTIFCLRHFYSLGAFWGDSAVLASLMWHSDLSLHTPVLNGGESFFSTHLALIFLPLSGLSWLLPLTRVQFYAGFQGACHASMALAVYWALVSCYGMRSPRGRLGAAAIGILFAFNGLAIAAARNPHFEPLIAGSGMLFLVALTRDQIRLATLFFAVCLMTREDAGFHLFGLLAVLAVFDRWNGLPWRRQTRVLSFALVAFGFSVAALLVQHLGFPAPHTSLSGVYWGDPPFSRITAHEIAERLRFYLAFRLYLILPAVVALIWAVRTGNSYLMAGYVAFIPWGLLHLFAASDFAGTLSNYYPFPFLIASFWPLLARVRPRVDHDGVRDPARGVITAPAASSPWPFVLMIAVSFVNIDRQHNPGQLDVPISFVRPPSLAMQRLTDRALEALMASDRTGLVLVDAAVASMVADRIREADLVSGDTSRRPDTVIWFVRGFQAPLAVAQAEAAGLELRFRVPGTAIRVASNRPLAGIADLVPDAVR